MSSKKMGKRKIIYDAAREMTNKIATEKKKPCWMPHKKKKPLSDVSLVTTKDKTYMVRKNKGKI